MIASFVLVLAGIAILLIIAVYNLFFLKRARDPNRKLFNIGHRGAAGLGPENTLYAINEGISNGADLIEVDVRQTLDKELVLFHNKRIRTIHGKKAINKHNYPFLNSSAIGSKFSAKPEIAGITLLREALIEIANSNAKLLIEIKNPSIYPAISKNLIDLIIDTNTTEKVLIFSFDADVIKEINLLAPAIPTGYLCLGVSNPDKYPPGAFISPNMISMIFRPSTIRALQRSNHQVFIWTVDNILFMKYLIRQNADGIITNRPDRLRDIL